MLTALIAPWPIYRMPISIVSFSKSTEPSTLFGKAPDFIWAIQVTKVLKHMLSSGWNYETYIKGATYAVEDEENEVKKSLVDEGFALKSIYMTEEEDVFVLPEE